MNSTKKYTTTKRAVIGFSIFLGVIIGLVLASNFNFTGNGFAHGDSNPPVINNTKPLAEIDSDIEATSRAFVAIAKKVTPTVVSITSEKVVKVSNPFSNAFPNDDFFRRFFQAPEGDGDREYTQRGLGSGVIVSTNGYILTNYHVVKEADEIDVVIDTKPYAAEVIGTDPATDLAVIKIDKDDLPAIALGNSDDIEVGEWVLAIGNPFDIRLQHTVTSGIISAKGRTLDLSGELTYQDFIQTDAAINPGNSGGALVNTRGELIGINTAILSGNAGGNVGIGFAIPINLAKKVMNDLIEHGEVVRGYLGVYISTPDEELSQALKLKNSEGAVVTQVIEGTPAAHAGLKDYDVITSVNGKAIKDSRELTNLVASYHPGEALDMTVIRDGKEKNLTVKLDQRPSANNAKPQESNTKTSDASGKLGIELSNLSPALAERYGYRGETGVLVVNVRPNSVAEEKGIRPGDLIQEVNRQPVQNLQAFKRFADDFEAGQIVLLQVKRGPNNHFVAMKIPQ